MLFNMTAFFHHVNSAWKLHSWRRRCSCHSSTSRSPQTFSPTRELEEVVGKPPRWQLPARMTFPSTDFPQTAYFYTSCSSHMEFIYTIRQWNSGRGRWPNTCSPDEGNHPFHPGIKTQHPMCCAVMLRAGMHAYRCTINRCHRLECYWGSTDACVMLVCRLSDMKSPEYNCRMTFILLFFSDLIKFTRSPTLRRCFCSCWINDLSHLLQLTFKGGRHWVRF